MDRERSRLLLKDIAKYGWSIFTQVQPNTNTISSKHILLIAYMSQAQVHIDGVVSLTSIRKAQASTAALQLRALQEYFIHTKFITLQDNDVFANYSYINSEYSRIQTAKFLLRNKEITQQVHDNTVNEANAIIDDLKPSTILPVVPHLISQGKDYYGNHQFKIRTMCEIIDALDTDNQSIHNMLDNYDAVYKHLSGYTHPDARTILWNINYTSNTSAININGDSTLYEIIMTMSFMYYAAILEIFATEFGVYESRRFSLFNTRFHKYMPTNSQ